MANVDRPLSHFALSGLIMFGMDLKTRVQASTVAAQPWHAMAHVQVATFLDTPADGLTANEASRRLEQFGPNALPPPPKHSPLRRFLRQFDNFLLQVLLGAVAIMAAIGHHTDAAVILAVVLVNALMGFIQEGKAENAIRSIQKMVSHPATVIRAGTRLTIAADGIVRGDLVLIESGDRVPADMRLVRLKNLSIDEAALTGESVPVVKQTGNVDGSASLGDRTCMAFSGTLVTCGQAAGIAVATGTATEIGRIGTMLAAVEPLETPLLRQMTRFAQTLTIAIVLLSGAVFLYGALVRQQPVADLFLAVVTLAVAAIPEALPAALTIAMAIGVQRMAKRQALIRRLPAVETLGSVSVICTDKTGTLTRNEMTATDLITAEHHYGPGVFEVQHASTSGSAAEPCSDPVLMETLRAAVLCNSANVRRNGSEWIVEGDPMEGALLISAVKAGLDPDQTRKQSPQHDVIPFESDHRFMAVLHHGPNDDAIIYVKGAPERILEMCSLERTAAGDRPLREAAWVKNLEAMASQGQRTLAVAMKHLRSRQATVSFSDVESGLTLLGLFGIVDPPRPEAVAAVAACRAAGIRVKMITGDHAATARAIGGQLGFENTAAALTGPQIEVLTDKELAEQVSQVDIFARASPEHKLRLVQALQAGGAVVAMTGDGVNDAPALKRADVGIAMGIKGTEAAKEAAQVVLADDNFASIANAVCEGRTIYDNLKKTIAFFLPINGGESLSIVVAILAGVTLPITPLQVLWINMVSSLCLALTLAFEPAEPDAMSRPPRSPKEPILSAFLAWRVAFVSSLFVVSVFGVFEWAIARGAAIEEARTLAVNTLVVMEVFYLFSVRFMRTPSITLRGVLGTPVVLAAVTAVACLQLLFTYAPFMHRFLATRPVSLTDWWPVFAAGISLLLILEIEKLTRRRLGAA